jgi:membrane protease YdiL (CAAX protease family)
MSLTSIRVYPDWEERLRQSQADDKYTWRVALVTFALSVLFLFIYRATPLEPVPGAMLADGIVKALYLTVGLILTARRVNLSRPWLAGACLLVIASVLLREPLAQQIDEDTANRTFSFLLSSILVILLVVLGWGILGLAFLRRRKECRLARLGTRLLQGLIAGGLIAVLMYLSQSFAGSEAMLAFPLTPLLVQRIAYAVGMQSVAEELFFRGIIFGHLYRRREKGFWTATGITLLLNLVVYAIQLPPFISPLGVALRLTAACTMIVINTELYSREASLIGPIVSNAIFQISFLAMGWG